MNRQLMLLVNLHMMNGSDNMAYKNIEDRRSYNRQYIKERREWLKSHYFCTECGKQDAYTLNGRYYCYECNEKHNIYNKTNYNAEKAKEYSKLRIIKCQNNGICTKCKKREAVSGRKQCSVCLAKDRQRWHNNNDSGIPRHLRNSYGLCYKCGEKLDGQHNTDGSESKLCSSCYNNTHKPPKTRILFTPFCFTENSMKTWEKCLEKREELLANGTYDYIPIVNVQPRR